MNVEQYVARRASSYNLRWEDDDTCVVLLGHICFPMGMKLNTARIEKIESLSPCTDTLRVKKIAKKLNATLERNARSIFREYKVNMHPYKCSIEYNMSYCDIFFSLKNGNTITLRRVFFSDSTGEILESIMGFG